MGVKETSESKVVELEKTRDELEDENAKKAAYNKKVDENVKKGAYDKKTAYDMKAAYDKKAASDTKAASDKKAKTATATRARGSKGMPRGNFVPIGNLKL